jgi:Mg2+ and Co2+ transporter CorA
LVIDRNESKHFKQFITFQERILSEEESIDPFIIFYELLDYVVTKAYKAIFKFRSDIADLESDLFKFENDLDVVKDILIIKKDLINFESYIEPLQDTILDLEIKSAKFHPEAKDRLDSTLDIVKKILNNLRNFKEQMNLLSETNDALMTRSTNHFLRLFTVASLLVAIPNIWTSFFGMNVFFGFPENYLPLICIILLILITIICIIKYLKKKRWL